MQFFFEGGGLLYIVGVVAFATLILALLAGRALRRRHDRRDEGKGKARGAQDGYIVTSSLSLLGILLGFTFSLAIDRYDARRVLVLTEANAIQTLYLRAQLLDEPHRSRLSGLLVEYTDNRVALAATPPGEAQQAMLATSDALLRSVWASAAGAYRTIQNLDFSSAFIESANMLIDLDTSRKAARLAHVPVAVFVLLFFFLITTASVLGYAQPGDRGRSAASFQLFLLTLFLLLVIDLDGATRGAVRESQGAMERLRTTLPSWREPAS